jgi:hypothetical protein
MLSKVLRNVVPENQLASAVHNPDTFDILITTNLYLSRLGVFMLMIFSLEKVFCLPGGNIECEPSLVVRVNNFIVFDSRGNQPIANCLDDLLGWSKHFVDLFHSQMLTEVGRIWMSAGRLLDSRNMLERRLDERIEVERPLRGTHTSMRCISAFSRLF